MKQQLAAGLIVLGSCCGASAHGGADGVAHLGVGAGEGAVDPGPVRALVLSAERTDADGSLWKRLDDLSPGRFEFHHATLGWREGQPGGGGFLLDGPDRFTEFDVVIAQGRAWLGALSPELRLGLVERVRDGGGFVGIDAPEGAESGAGLEPLLGGRPRSDGTIGDVGVRVDAAEHPVTRGLPGEWTLRGELHGLRGIDESGSLVLARGLPIIDADDIARHPVAWEKNLGRGRVFYTVLGRDARSLEDEHFVGLISNAIVWASDAPLPDADGVYTLFDGTSTDGWAMTGPGEFVHENPGEDGVLLATGGMGMLWYERRRFRDFELTIEWKNEQASDNSGVFVRFHEPPNSPWDAVRKGHEIQIYDIEEGEHMTGAIYNHAPATRLASNAPGEWNTFVISVIGHDYTVVLNGETVCEWTCPPERHGREGYIGLQNHSGPVRFRNIRVREIGSDR